MATLGTEESDHHGKVGVIYFLGVQHIIGENAYGGI